MPASFESFFDQLPIGAYRADPDGTIVRTNAAMARMLGIPDADAVPGWLNERAGHAYVHESRRAEFLALLRAHGEVRDFVSEVRRAADGETGMISECAWLVRDESGRVVCYEGTVEDVTARTRAQAELQLTLDNAGRGIARIDAQGRVVLYNRRLLELLDLPEELLAARPYVGDVIRFQDERGDFGDHHELIDEVARPVYERDRSDFILNQMTAVNSYLRRTRDGRVIEVTTTALPDGGVVRTYSELTAYMVAQRDLAEKSRALQITLDSMSQGIVAVDASSRVVMYNRRYQELLNFPDELMAQRPTMEQMVRFQIDRGDFGPNFEFVDAVARGYVAVGDKVPPLQGPETYLRKTRDGQTLEVHTRPLPDGGMVRTFTDMTAYVQAQEALALKEAQLSALVRNLPDRVWLKDAAGVYRLSNPAHARHFGLREDEIVGRTAHELLGPEVGDRQAATDRVAMLSDTPLVYEDRLPSRADGTVQDVEIVKVGMRDEAGRCVGMLGIARDITVRKKAEAALIAAKEAAEAGERTKAEFLANVSHEIRTPMNAVIGMSDLLLTTPLTATQREFAQAIRTSGGALLGLINDILDFSKMESGRLELEREPVDLVDCVESAFDITGGAAVAKGLELLLDIAPGVPTRVWGDTARLRQVLVNLLGNAVKFTPRGDVTVSLSRHAAADGDRLQVAVRDHGIGIAPERMDRLFQVFSQVDASTTRQYGGTGLGLAICRKLVTLMGGSIGVTSEPGVGSTFTFDIPCEPVDAAVARADAPLSAGARVLLVDDDGAARRVFEQVLRDWGLEVGVAAGGASAAMLIAQSGPWDALVLDERCAGAADLLRGQGAALPCVLLRAGLPATSGAEEAAGAVVLKPVKRRMLRQALSSVLQPGGAPGPAVVNPAPPPASQAVAFPLRVLLAEDNEVNQIVAQHMLQGLGYGVDIVGNGQLALDAVRSARERGDAFDVVLMDVQMPELDGLEAARHLVRLYPSGAERPWIVAMTANAMPGDREECLAAGMDDYLSKPIRPDEVGAALRRAFEGLAQRRR